jgi:histidinol-phosphate/aromatic aminotransferase/cobyric acid decarboxylase-like protein/choline kinase
MSTASESSEVDVARERDVQAVILAAGYARRMRPLSDQCHKALLPIKDTTILGRILDSFVRVGIRRVTVVTGYRANDVVRYIRERQPDIDLRVVHNAQYMSTNNIVSLSMALDEMTLDADVVVVDCDILIDPLLMAKLVNHPGENVALVDRYRTGMDGTVVSITDGRVVEFFPISSQDADFDYTDKYKTLNINLFNHQFCEEAFRPLLHSYAYEVDSSCFYSVVVAMLTIGGDHALDAEIVNGEHWAEVDDPNDLAVANYKFDPEQRVNTINQTIGGLWNFDLLDFSVERNQYFPTGPMLAAMRHALPDLIADHGSDQATLNAKLGYFLECDPALLQVIHGPLQVSPTLRRRFAGRRAVAPASTLGSSSSIFPAAVAYLDLPATDLDEVRRLALDETLVFLENPNSSSGSTVATTDVHEMARANRNTTFVVDESSLPYTSQPSLVALLETAPLNNVVVLSSLGNCLGAPGLQLGYVYSSDRELIETIGEELTPWNLSTPAEFMLELLLKFRSAYATSLRHTAEDRETLRAALANLAMVTEVLPGEANFLHVLLADDGIAMADRLRRTLIERFNIEVRDVSRSAPDYASRIRVAVRRSADIERLVLALRILNEELADG